MSQKAPRSWRTRARAVLSSSRGSYDPATVMVGTVIAGILTAGIGISAVAMVPWSQDREARDRLEAVRTAQSAAMTSDRSNFDLDPLIERGYLPGTDTVAVRAGIGGGCYVALAASGSGTVFYATGSQGPSELRPDTQPGCLSESVLREMITDVGADTTGRNPGVTFADPPAMGGTSVSGSKITFGWAAAEHAVAYLPEINTGDGWRTLPQQTATQLVVESEPGQEVSVRVASVNADSSTSGTSTVATRHVRGPSNLLANAGFEDVLRHWRSSGPAASATRNFPDAGDYSLQLPSGAWASQTVDIHATSQPRVGFRARLSVDTDVTVIQLRSGDVIAEETFTAPKSADGTWQDYIVFDDYLDPATNQLELVLHGAGGLRAGTASQFDDVFVEVSQ